jgi:hypothetical protein
MMTHLPLFLDGLMVLLLLVTIIYAVVLHRRLAALRGDRQAFETFVTRFDAATARAESAVRGLKNAAEECKKQIGDPMARAEAMRDELLFLIDRADTVAGRVASSTRREAEAGGDPAAAQGGGERRLRQAASRPARHAGAAAEEDPAVGSQAERDLLNALRKARQ